MINSHKGNAQAMSTKGMTAKYILSLSMRYCYDANDIFVNIPRNESKISSASRVMVQSIQDHLLDHLLKTAGKDELAISKNGMKATKIIPPSKNNGDHFPGLLKEEEDCVSSSKGTIIYLFTKQTATEMEDTTTTPSYMSCVAQGGNQTSRPELTYGGIIFPSEVLPLMNSPGRVEKGFLPRFTPVAVDNNAREQEGMPRTVIETYRAYLNTSVDVPCLPVYLSFPSIHQQQNSMNEHGKEATTFAMMQPIQDHSQDLQTSILDGQIKNAAQALTVSKTRTELSAIIAPSKNFGQDTFRSFRGDKLLESPVINLSWCSVILSNELLLELSRETSRAKITKRLVLGQPRQGFLQDAGGATTTTLPVHEEFDAYSMFIHDIQFLRLITTCEEYVAMDYIDGKALLIPRQTMEQSASVYLIIRGRPCDGIIIQFLAMNASAKDSRRNNFIMDAKMACQTNYNEQNAFDPKNKRIRTTSYEDGERLIASRVHRSIDTMVLDTTADEITSFKDGAIKENSALVNITIGITTTADAPHHMSGSRGES
jgi:hypothetical protein